MTGERKCRLTFTACQLILQKDLRLNPQVKIYMIVILIIDICMDTNLQKDAHVTILGYVTAPHCYM